MSVMQPFLVGVVPWLTLVNRELLVRLNSDPSQTGAGSWAIDTGQLALSKPGAYRIVWQLIGGSVEKASLGQQGNQAVAPKLADRKPRVRCEIRSNEARSVGLTTEDITLAELVQRAVIQVVNAQRSADWGGGYEDWARFGEAPDQRQILFGFEFDIWLNVLDDPYLFKQINTVESTTELGTPP